jgi:hypothetical protein
MPDDKGNVTEQEKADLAKRRGMAANTITDPEEKRKFIAEQGDTEAKKKGLPVTDYTRLSTDSALKGYKDGTDYVPKTGPAVLHKGEKVVTKKDNDKLRAKGIYGDLSDHLGGEPQKHKKEIDHIKTRKAKSGGYIHEHHHTHPEDHPMEQHISADQDAMLSHMAEHMGEAQPGAGGPDEGQGGVPGV